MANTTISTRVPDELMNDVRNEIDGIYVNEADFFRSAVRNELMRMKINKIRKEFLEHKDSVKSVRQLRRVMALLSEEEFDTWVEEASGEMPKNL